MAGLLTWSTVDHLPAETAFTGYRQWFEDQTWAGSGARVDLLVLSASPHSYGDSSGFTPVFPFNAVNTNS